MTATHLDSLGVMRRLGLAASSPHLVAAMNAYSDASPMVDPSDYRAFDDTVDKHGELIVPVKNQGQFGACDGHTAAEAVEYVRMLQGLTRYELSAWWVYANLCQGNDVGAGILDALDFTRKYGVCRDELVPWGTIDPRGFTQAMAADALRFRVQAGSQITTWEELVSAVTFGRPCNIAVSAGPNFSSLDSEGVPPPNEGGLANHSVLAVPGLKFSRQWGWLVKVVNHWTPRWGQKGCFWASRHHTNVQYFEAYSVAQSTLDPAGDLKGFL